MNLFSEMATMWLRAAAAQMKYWQDASDKWQETVSKMTGIMPKVDTTPSRYNPEIFKAPWMPAWMKGAQAETPVGAWPLPVHGAPGSTTAEPDETPTAAAKPQAVAKLVSTAKPAAPAKPKPAAKPDMAPAVALKAVPQDSGIPPLLDTPPAVPDDLLQMKGVGPKILKLLNDLGIYTFAQISAWTPEHIAWIEGKLDFKGRVTREDWVAQAKTLAGLPRP